MNTSRTWKERRLTQGTWCSTCLRGGREGVPAASGTCRRDRLQSRRRRPLYSSHSCHSSLRATCLRDRRRRRPEPTDTRLETQGRRQIRRSVCVPLTAWTSLQRTGARSSFLNCPKDPSISDLSKGELNLQAGNWQQEALALFLLLPTDTDAGHFGASLCLVDRSINTFACLPGVRQLHTHSLVESIWLPKAYLIKTLT